MKPDFDTLVNKVSAWEREHDLLGLRTYVLRSVAAEAHLRRGVDSKGLPLGHPLEHLPLNDWQTSLVIYVAECHNGLPGDPRVVMLHAAAKKLYETTSAIHQ